MVVQLFNTVLADFRAQSAPIPNDATPREAEGILISKLLVCDKRVLDRFISAFEEADYSIHPNGRQHYERACHSLANEGINHES